MLGAYDDVAGEAAVCWRAGDCDAGLGGAADDVGKPATFQHAPGDRIRFNGHVEVGVRIAGDFGAAGFSNEDTAQIVALVKNHMRFGDVMEMRESTLKRFLRLPQLRSTWRCIGWR